MTAARFLLALLAVSAGAGSAARAEDLYRGNSWAAISADRRASAVGDALTILIFQSAEASNSAQNASRRSTELSGGLSVSSVQEQANAQISGGYSGRGEVSRSERLVTQITVTVQSVLPNGDLMIAGEQYMRVNGERTRIGVRGRVRPADIASDNTLLSNRVADAQIDYDGRGFVSRSARPGLINRIFGFLGLG